MSDPELTGSRPPMKVQIADAIRIKIENGTYVPGDELPTLKEIAEQWSRSVTSARDAIALLKSQGLVSTHQGGRTIVRKPPRKVVRDSARHQEEKDLVLADEETRSKRGEAEDDLGYALDDVESSAVYTVVDAGAELSSSYGWTPDEPLIRKEYTKTPKGSDWPWLSHSVSYSPRHLFLSRPDLLTDKCEPWPGGHQHQLREVGIEIGEIVDQVSARMPSTAEAQRWDLSSGVPMMKVRRISIDTAGNVVEVSDAEYPADRTLLQSHYPLKLWSDDADPVRHYCRLRPDR